MMQIAKQAGYRATLVVGVLVDHFPEPSAPLVIFLLQHEPSPSLALLHLTRLARHSACLDFEQPYSFTKSGFLGNSSMTKRKTFRSMLSRNGESRYAPGRVVY
jgi:hypothetical protein